MTSAQRKILSNASSDVDRARLFNLMTTGKNLQGFVGDKSFNVGFGGAGTTTSYMGSINSQISRSMGYSANAGNGFSAMAYGAGGMKGMEAMAVAGTALNTATTAINTISNLNSMGGKAMNMARGFMGGSGGGQSSGIPMRDLVVNSSVEFQGSGVASNLTIPQGANLAFQGGNKALMRQITNPASARFKMGVDDLSFFGGKGGGAGGGGSGGMAGNGVVGGI